MHRGVRKHRVRKWLKKMWGRGMVRASLTVEASILIPFILFAVAGGIKIGYSMFQEAKTVTEIHEELIQLDPVGIVRRNTLLQG